MMLKFGKHIYNVSILSNSVAKLDQTWGFFIIAISSLQSVLKLWHVECWSIFSIVHRSASTFECKADSRRAKFLVPISWMFSPLSIQTHLYPLKWAMDVQNPSIKQILPKFMTCGSLILLSCITGCTTSLASNETWHSLSGCRTSSKASILWLVGWR